MDAEVRKAAEHVLQYVLPIETPYGVGYTRDCDSPLVIAQAATVAKAYLAEHPADEDEPVTIGWLNTLQREGGDMSFLRVRLCEDATLRLMSPCDTPSEGINGLKDFVSPRPSTRGDVRRLCRAIGIELKE